MRKIIHCARRAKSLSARRAWIEKANPGKLASLYTVALRKESVDRKVAGSEHIRQPAVSLSARRAWIEKTEQSSSLQKITVVALRKESVDRKAVSMGRLDHGPQSLSARRAWIEKLTMCIFCSMIYSRSPQGERG